MTTKESVVSSQWSVESGNGAAVRVCTNPHWPGTYCAYWRLEPEPQINECHPDGNRHTRRRAAALKLREKIKR